MGLISSTNCALYSSSSTRETCWVERKRSVTSAEVRSLYRGTIRFGIISTSVGDVDMSALNAPATTSLPPRSRNRPTSSGDKRLTTRNQRLQIDQPKTQWRLIKDLPSNREGSKAPSCHLVGC